MFLKNFGEIQEAKRKLVANRNTMANTNIAVSNNIVDINGYTSGTLAGIFRNDAGSFLNNNICEFIEANKEHSNECYLSIDSNQYVAYLNPVMLVLSTNADATAFDDYKMDDVLVLGEDFTISGAAVGHAYVDDVLHTYIYFNIVALKDFNIGQIGLEQQIAYVNSIYQSDITNQQKIAPVLFYKETIEHIVCESGKPYVVTFDLKG